MGTQEISLGLQACQSDQSLDGPMELCQVNNFSIARRNTLVISFSLPCYRASRRESRYAADLIHATKHESKPLADELV
jgi:hypothetical protein